MLSRRPTNTDPSTHPSTDEVSEGVRVVAAAARSARIRFRLGHDGVDAGDGSLDDACRAGYHDLGQTIQSPGAPTSCTHTTGWSAHPAIALAEYFDVPLVSTIHATEAGRHSGWVSGPISRQVHAVESWLVRESDSLITCSRSMSDEITELFGPASPKSGSSATESTRGCGRSRSGGRERVPRSCSTSAGWSTRRASTTRSPRCRASGGHTRGPR